MFRRTTTAVALVAASAIALSGCATSAGQSADDETTITFRLWDDQAAKAYEESFAAFEKENPGIHVDINVVGWNDYWTKLRTDVAGKTMDDVFWVNNAYFGAYADSGNLVDVTDTLGSDAADDWQDSVVDQFTRDGKLWGVPQLYDAGIAVYYNKALLDAAGVDPATLDDLTWSPDPATDTYLPVAKKLTKDAAGVDAATAGFDGTPVTYGTNIAYDLQAIVLPFIGSNGGTYQDGDEFAFADPKTVEAFTYMVDAVNTAKVAPSAADTNGNPDFSRDQFLQGKMAMFQSGLYNLKNIADGADFEWGVAMMPAGPAGRVSVTNGIVAAGNAGSEHPEAVKKLLEWLGTSEGNGYLGESGAAVPGVKSAQKQYFDYWEGEGVSLDPFFDVIEGHDTIPAPQGADFGAGFAAYDPIFQEIFKGSIDPATGLQRGQDAANAAIDG